MAAGFGLLAVFLSLVSIRRGFRLHCTKLFAIALVAALAFLADHVSVYFVSIFIVATAVTELEFLENIAAMVTRSRGYFEYKKEALGSRHARLRTEGKREAGTGEPRVATASELRREHEEYRLGYAAEQLALARLEEVFGCQIERNLRLSRKGHIAEVDGLIDNPPSPVQLFEVKMLYGVKSARQLVEDVPHLRHLVEQVERITRRTTDLHVAVIIPAAGAFAEELASLSRALDGLPARADVIALSRDEIGLVDDIAIVDT